MLLAKPTSHTSQVITSGGTIKLGTAGADFYIKVKSAIIDGTQKMHPTTGDGDAAPSFDLNYFAVTHIVFNGWFVAYSVSSSVVNFLINFIDKDKNPLAASLKLTMGTSIVLTVPELLIPSYKIGYDRGDGVLPLMLNCYATDSHTTMAAT